MWQVINWIYVYEKVKANEVTTIEDYWPEALRYRPRATAALI